MITHAIPAPLTVTATLHCDDGTPLPVTTRLTYTADDPFAVAVKFWVAGDQVDWVMARSTLMAALATGESGVGDVRCWRPVDDDDNLAVKLCSPDGDALLTFPAGPLDDWLQATVRAVSVEDATRRALAALDAELLDIDAGAAGEP